MTPCGSDSQTTDKNKKQRKEFSKCLEQAMNQIHHQFVVSKMANEEKWKQTVHETTELFHFIIDDIVDKTQHYKDQDHEPIDIRVDISDVMEQYKGKEDNESNLTFGSVDTGKAESESPKMENPKQTSSLTECKNINEINPFQIIELEPELEDLLSMIQEMIYHRHVTLICVKKHIEKPKDTITYYYYQFENLFYELREYQRYK